MSDDESPFERGWFRYARIDGRGRGEDPEEPEGAEDPEGEDLRDEPQQRRGGRGSRIGDRVIGVALGLALGIAIIAGFVFLAGEDTIDAPRIDDQPPAREAPASPAGSERGGQERGVQEP